MGDAFVETLLQEARANPDIVLMTGDLGFGVLERFAEELPAQFLNAGVAEQNMIGMAAGIASTGRRVFVYSIANFPTLRCLEQIRNDVCYHAHDVKIVSIGAGLAYGTLGYTHHAIEDLAAMRALPNLDVVSPADPLETASATRLLARTPGPAYLRLGKSGEALLHTSPPVIERGQAIPLRDGSDVTLAATGSVLQLAIMAGDVLETEHGIRSAVWSVPYVSPFDEQALARWSLTSGVVTVEEHVLAGGFGSACWEASTRAGIDLRIRPVALAAQDLSCVGSATYLRERRGLTVERIMSAATALVKRL